MTVHFSDAVRNAMLDAIESTIGASPVLRLYASGGTPPANAAAAITGTKIAEGAGPADWANDAAAGSKTKKGTWTVTGVTAAGTGTNVDYYRVYDAAGTTCHEQGTITITGSGGDVTMDNTSVANGQNVTVNTLTHNAGNA